MCYFSYRGKNRKYEPNKKNGYRKPAPPKDERLLGVEYSCGWCEECRKQKAIAWRIRLEQELWEGHRLGLKANFITLTFSEESIDNLSKAAKSTEANEIATIAVRRFLERIRKETKKSARHWMITELGGQATERIHIHGIIWSKDGWTKEKLTKKWKYGRTDPGEYCNEKTINYITKYMMKVDTVHKNYRPIILCSPGIGRAYVNSKEAKERHKWRGPEKTDTTMRYRDGGKCQLPQYYRRKLFTDEQREEMLLNKLNKQITYLAGEKYIMSIRSERKRHSQDKKFWKKESIKKGFTTTPWQRKYYEARKRKQNEEKINTQNNWIYEKFDTNLHQWKDAWEKSAYFTYIEWIKRENAAYQKQFAIERRAEIIAKHKQLTLPIGQGGETWKIY